MSLSRKILLRNLILLGGLIILGGTALLGMFSLWGSVLVASDEYAELRRIESIVRGVEEARGLLRTADADPVAAAERLRATQADLERFAAIQLNQAEGPKAHENDEDRAIQRSLQDLRIIIDQLQDPAKATDATAGPIERLGDMGRRFSALAHEADELVASTQQKANHDLRRGTFLVGCVFLLIAGAATVIGLMQYRSIIRPLESLRQAVRRIASGSFEQRVAVDGEREFAELAGDFNHMADQLDDLYRTLERKVEHKSRELVQSERLASVGFLAAGVAHEINNPLGIISGYAELSLKRLRDDATAAAVEDARRSLGIIRDEAFRCREITERLLNLARDRSGRDGMVLLDRVIDDVVRMIQVHKRYKQSQIDVDLARADGLVVRGNESELKQVLLNLVVNALDAGSASAPAQVRISVGAEGSHVVLRVTDDGCGMTSEVLDRVFEPFFSSKHGEQRGVGLGLSITRAIVEGCGGEIRASSGGAGLGSEFTVRLQRFDSSAAQVRRPTAEVPA